MSSYAFARKLDLPFTTSPVRGVGGDPMTASRHSDVSPMRGAGAIQQGVGALEPATQALVQAGAIGGIMFYGVVLAIKGSLLYGGAAFIGGPMVVSYVLSKAMNY